MPIFTEPVTVRPNLSSSTPDIELTAAANGSPTVAFRSARGGSPVLVLQEGDVILRSVTYSKEKGPLHDEETLRLSGDDGGIYAGGRGHEGRLLLFPESATGEFPNPNALFKPVLEQSFVGKATVEVTADNGMTIYDGKGGVNVAIGADAAEAHAVLGGSGKLGLVALLPPNSKQGGNPRDSASVVLDAGSSVLTVRGPNGLKTKQILLNGAAGWIQVTDFIGNSYVIIGTDDARAFGIFGGNAKDGVIALLPAKADASKNPIGTAAIILDAATGDITLRNADCAEDFEAATDATLEPGTVVVLDEAGRMRECTSAYDARVAGVVSGAGGLAPGIVLGRTGATQGRVPVALAGKVFCKVDAEAEPIRPGDLLTTSPTPGHAMRVTERERALGTILGKALAPASGRSLIPMLVTLQ
jgi:hypothetical protein